MRELFPGQEETERVYLIIREHWFTLLANLLIWLVFAAVLVAIGHYLPVYLPALLNAPYVYYLDLFKDLLILFMALGVFMTWALYFLNIKIVTDQRVVEISFTSVLSHTISELSITKIEDVTSDVSGLFGNLFSFGNVYVQTAGRVERFIFDNVPAPDKLERLILNLYDMRMKQVPPETIQQIQP